MPKSIKLKTARWSDGTSPDGLVNIVCEEMELVVAKEVSTEIAEEICRLWNAKGTTSLISQELVA